MVAQKTGGVAWFPCPTMPCLGMVVGQCWVHHPYCQMSKAAAAILLFRSSWGGSPHSCSVMVCRLQLTNNKSIVDNDLLGKDHMQNSFHTWICNLIHVRLLFLHSHTVDIRLQFFVRTTFKLHFLWLQTLEQQYQGVRRCWRSPSRLQLLPNGNTQERKSVP